ncbi:winged helix-turn-helix transcriptional regulator [Streptomyces koyangensis]
MDIALAVPAGRWTPLVLREFLRRERATYSELSAALPALSDKVLSDRLTQLTGADVLDRHRVPGWPPHVRYTLTEQGRALEPVLHSVGGVGHRPTAGERLTPPRPHLVGHAGGAREQQGRDAQLPTHGGQ